MGNKQTLQDTRAKEWIAKRKHALDLYGKGLAVSIIGRMLKSPRSAVIKMVDCDPPNYVIAYLKRQGFLK